MGTRRLIGGGLSILGYCTESRELTMSLGQALFLAAVVTTILEVVPCWNKEEKKRLLSLAISLLVTSLIVIAIG